MTTLTAADARRIARQARTYGHFHQTDSPDYAVTCPRCRARVTTQRNTGWQPVRPGEPHSEVVNGKQCAYRTETITQALDRAMLAHLTEPGECRP